MNRFYIIANRQKDKNLEMTKKICRYLEAHGKVCDVYQDSSGHEFGRAYKYTNADMIPQDVDCVLVLGGDGTLIQGARDTVKRNIPILGFNLGTLGFLTEIENDHIDEALDKLINDEFLLESRMMLQGITYCSGKPVFKDIALNDIVLNRSGALRIVQYEIYVNGEFLYSCPADGIIISTPTGSTGYNLSAGGPIVAPDSKMIVLTPICPHSLNSSSIVLSANDRIIVKIGPGRRNTEEQAEATFDGAESVPLVTGDYIEITQAKETIKLIKINKMSFVEVIRKKMQ